MSQQSSPSVTRYAEEKEIQWHVNTGSNKIHAKRIPGRFRNLKWMGASIWLLFFLGPYIQWEGRQAVLFDIPGRQFHLFGLTIHPHDIWLLSFVLLFFAGLLMLSTVIAGRAFCGYFCFQTVWTDLFSFIEEKLEGPPKARYQLDASPWDMRKLSIKVVKHLLWLMIGLLTGISFAAWFTDSYQLWQDYFNLSAHTSAWIVLGLFTTGTYLFAGFMREQVCFWMCPYARLQGVMYDKNTLLPVYDDQRGEPRAKLGKSKRTSGACVDCDQCLAVCPTGIDIREGQQLGCITCGLCIDACDRVMEKIDRPKGLIRYASLNQLSNKTKRNVWKQPVVILATALMATSVLAATYSLNNITAAEMSVVSYRNPMYTVMSDGSIQNRYEVRIFNKTDDDHSYRISALSDVLDQSKVKNTDLAVKSGKMASTIIAVRIPVSQLQQEITPITLKAFNLTTEKTTLKRSSVFIAPKEKWNITETQL